MDILYQIRARQDSFSAGEGRIARLMLNDVGFASAASLDELAQRAEVSTATLSRFARTVGCRDLRDLRLQLAQASGVGSRFLDPAGTPDQSAFYGQIVGDIESTLRQHLSAFDESRFADAVKLLGKARMIHAFGLGGCSTLCSDELQVRLVRFGYPIAACHDPVMMRVTAASLDAERAVIACSLTGITPELIDAVELARNYGARIIAITRADSPLAQLADVLLPLQGVETSFIYKPTAARYGMLLAIDVLATELALANPEDNQERLRRIKLALDDYRGGDDRLPLGD
ncbi:MULTISPECIES: MurR/RpiR family transcriptional regulator [Pseudomonas]|jgi:DNA-binding MurR/RpiR family transcriptional regulator|uniref:DNA-binding transcriptional regulator, MurR/RpiR family, contains HTH and SIS domains n=2 Tax=Pseudomonas fluorescens group TaxID=136843 RepID=A0AB36CTJ2_9PSED|nr:MULTISPECIES: MurR/RpiR family transcriptional regulator [Pseudomonas]MBU0525953.1 MurR/RpiR family transcriptional regulator [Gammaproteobacteria bacterium]MDF9883213.1 DNA-binding MurR/RpiR family transcriptional regulator [Pseudomonas silensiensis]MBU0818833.1 MurR/RpiR family transcriptional regulator [Gammaproteobacteria bacterium]MBU0844237.1 MurR/RpiR family transcriptional regulator [Gammaproteobacteria bacterium]MBU1843608.1 MurR/RpiR family transcriptional regulator [Gammaproteoba